MPRGSAARRRRRPALASIKGRVADALVESIFRRALYRMTRDQTRAADFVALKQGRAGGDPRAAGRTFMIAVKYRSDLTRYLALQQRGGAKSLLAKGKAKSPNLYVIFVTDRPSEGRSCFQALDLAAYRPGGPVTTRPLYELEALEIFPNNVIEHEALAKQLFGLLSSFSS